MHAYKFPQHEQRIAALLKQEAPDIFVSLSSDVCPEVREFDRASTTVVNAYTRPQMVRREINPRYYDMIQAFADRTGVPMVLNTSFNLKGEPMVNTPRDALRTFFSSGLDALLINDILVRKPRA